MAKNTGEKEYIEIDLLRVLQALWHRAWIIVLTIVVFGASFFSYSYFLLKPEYTATAMFYVNNSALSLGSQLSISSTELTAAQSLVDTYVVILNSRKVLDEVREKAGVTEKYSHETLKEMISAQAVNSTEVFEVNVVSNDRYEAERIADMICDVLPDKIELIVKGSTPTIVDEAVVPSKKSGPNVTGYTAIGMLIGFVVSCVVIIIMELFDQFIRSEEYLMQTFEDIPVLAVIPDLEGDTSKGRYYYSYRSKGD